VTNFELVNLDDKEFETLACRLLSAELGIRFERFKLGRDKGVDGRYFVADKGEAILQCKHWIRSPVSTLIRMLERTEQAKVQTLRPKRYLLVTSVELSRTDKQKIATIFKGYLHSESDVFGFEDVNDLLAKHSEIVKAFPSLWLASAEVIGLIQNAAILGRSDFSLGEIRSKATRYVATKSHAAARLRLEETGVVLITGLPGIGKTTLAEQWTSPASIDTC
jgi:hypothetical protein